MKLNPLPVYQKGQKRRRKPSGSDSDYLNLVAEVGCIVCLIAGIHSPACIHHLRDGQGMGQRADDRTAIGLCHHHHQGVDGIHTLGTRTWQAKFGTERELLRRLRIELGEDTTQP